MLGSKLLIKTLSISQPYEVLIRRSKMETSTSQTQETKSEADEPKVGQTLKSVEEQEENDLGNGETANNSESDAGLGSEKTTENGDTQSSAELLKAEEDRCKDVEKNIYEMLRNEEMIYVSKTRKIVQFILFMILLLVGGFLVLLSRGLLFARMVSDRTTSQLAGHGLNVNGK